MTLFDFHSTSQCSKNTKLKSHFAVEIFMTFAHTYLRGRFSQQRSSTDKRRTLQFRPFCRRTSWGYSGFSDFEAHLSQGRFRQYNLICMRHAVESLGRPAPFATCYMVGREDKRTNNRTMLPTLKTMQLQVIKVQ